MGWWHTFCFLHAAQAVILRLIDGRLSLSSPAATGLVFELCVFGPAGVSSGDRLRLFIVMGVFGALVLPKGWLVIDGTEFGYWVPRKLEYHAGKPRIMIPFCLYRMGRLRLSNGNEYVILLLDLSISTEWLGIYFGSFGNRFPINSTS